MDLYNLNWEDLNKFFAYKEIQYEERRQKIMRMCQKLNSFPQNSELLKKLSKVSYYSIKYNSRDKVAYCQISKVSADCLVVNKNILFLNTIF